MISTMIGHKCLHLASNISSISDGITTTKSAMMIVLIEQCRGAFDQRQTFTVNLCPVLSFSGTDLSDPEVHL